MQGFAANGTPYRRLLRVLAGGVVVVLLVPAGLSPAQVLTVSPEKVSGHYLDFHPTNIALPAEALSARGKQDLIRYLTADQGFAMRPIPRASKGLLLHANGDMQPTGFDYLNELEEKGTSVKPGERCTITDVRIKEDRIILELNGGPDPKHKWMRHIQIGMGGATTPVVADNGQEPVGARITLAFKHDVPEVSGQTVEALLGPLLGFGVKSPVVAYTDTLPPQLKQAILDHHVLVGMSTEMVIYAMGQPQQKIREREGQMPFEEWIYGEPPNPVQFIRINGNRVIRVEIAEVGKEPVIRADNEMGDYWNTVAPQNVHEVKMGDAEQADAEKESAPKAPPTLRRPGETLPTDNDKDHPTMGPVQFPQGTGQQQTPSSQQTPPPPASQPTGNSPQQYIAGNSQAHP